MTKLRHTLPDGHLQMNSKDFIAFEVNMSGNPHRLIGSTPLTAGATVLS